LHIARQGRKGRHFVVFRETQGQYSIDLARHIPAAND
jgi:hypothetical protein